MGPGIDLEKLPCLARVAFAIRCARRAQGLLVQFAPDVSEDLLGAVDQAITLAERSSADGRPCKGLAAAVDEAERHARGAVGVAQVWSSGNGSDAVLLSAPVRRAVAYAAAAAACAVLETSARAASKAVSYAEEAARAANAAHLTAAMASDFEKLREAAGREGWADDQPVSPGFFGPS
jgi:hypothetical protein